MSHSCRSLPIFFGGNGEAALELYQGMCGAKIGPLLRFGGSPAEASAPPEWRNEAKRMFDGLAEGGTVTLPLGPALFAESFGMLVDRFGIPWMVTCQNPA